MRLSSQILIPENALLERVARMAAAIPAGRLVEQNGDPHPGGAVPEYVGFTVPDRWVVGYGLDADGLYRNLPYVTYVE